MCPVTFYRVNYARYEFYNLFSKSVCLMFVWTNNVEIEVYMVRLMKV